MAPPPPQKHSPAIKQGAKVLVIGAGRIGCEVLKTLALSGCQDIHIIDRGFVEVSDLNGQFLFRQSHVGKSKASSAQQAVLEFRPEISITSYHGNIKEPDFDVYFFKQFNVVLIGLDNFDARRHVNRLCLAADVPLIDSWTVGFLGQVTVHVNGITECYECRPKPAAETYPVCTITSTPSEFVHCMLWAKEILFAKLFGDKSLTNDLNGDSSLEQAEDVFDHRHDEDIEQYGRRIYDHVFGHNIEVALSNEEIWNNRCRPKPIYSRDALPNDVSQQNRNVGKSGATNDPLSVPAMVSLGLQNSQAVLGLMENSRVFLEALKLLFMKKEKEIGNITFDKDDQLAVVFVTAAANIKASAFEIPLHSLFEAKGIVGNIVPAVATTNAIIAGLIAIETVKVLQNDKTNYRMTYCLEHPIEKMLLMPVEPFEPNKSCYVCSKTPLSLEINTNRATLRDIVEKVVKNKLGMNSPLIRHGAALLYEDDLFLDAAMIINYEANLDKVLSEFLSPVTSGTMLKIEDFQQGLSCSINIKHREEFDEEKEPDGMVLSELTQATSVVKDEKKSNANAGSTSNAEKKMTYCLEHPIKKMLLMPVEPFEPNKSCYVCSKTPLSLEINTNRATLQDIVEKVVKNKLGMNSPLIMHGEALLYEDDFFLDAAMIINYEANLDKVLSEFLSPVTSGTMLKIEDFQQELSCSIIIKHREEFDEEKEPDGMVLSELTQATSVVKDDKKSNANAGSTSNASELEADKNNEIEIAPGKKRKWSEVSEDNPDDSAALCSLIYKGFKLNELKAVGGKGCRVCGSDQHHTVNCPLLKSVPPGSIVGPDYLVICCACGFELCQPTPEWCLQCCDWEQGGRAVEASKVDDIYRDPLKDYTEVL